MSFCKLFVTFLVVTSATAVPFIGEQDGAQTEHISVQTKLKKDNAGSYKGLIQRDFARVQALCARHNSKSKGSTFGQFQDTADVLDVPLTNGGTHFTAEIGVGTPAKKYQLLVDTGSSNTFLSRRAQYQVTASSTNTTHRTKVTYGSGEFEGFEFTDTVTLGDATISEQYIGVAEKDKGLEELDGILGLGPDELTRGTVENMNIVPTVTDSLAKQGKISAAVVGVSFPPSTDPQSEVGTLDFGAPDKTKFTGKVTYVPVTQTRPASHFWGIDQSITYGNKTHIMKSAAGIVDTGTTLLMLATDAFNAYVRATGAKPDDKTGLLKLDNAANLKSLFFHIGNRAFEFTANAQIWPRIYNTAIGGDSGATYLIVGDTKTQSGHGKIDFVIGLTFMQRFYTIYDTPNRRVGFATTSHTHAVSN